MSTLPNDYERCEGVSSVENGVTYWREGCETCLRRTAPRSDWSSWIAPPQIVAFECEFLIEPHAVVSHKPLK